jgi:hypothetical protein
MIVGWGRSEDGLRRRRMRRTNDKSGRNDRNEGNWCMMKTGSGAGGKTGQGAQNWVICGTSKVFFGAICPNIGARDCAECNWFLVKLLKRFHGVMRSVDDGVALVLTEAPLSTGGTDDSGVNAVHEGVCVAEIYGEKCLMRRMKKEAMRKKGGGEQAQ